jgi:hypothetical protein
LLINIALEYPACHRSFIFSQKPFCLELKCCSVQNAFSPHRFKTIMFRHRHSAYGAAKVPNVCTAVLLFAVLVYKLAARFTVEEFAKSVIKFRVMRDPKNKKRGLN